MILCGMNVYSFGIRTLGINLSKRFLIQELFQRPMEHLRFHHRRGKYRGCPHGRIRRKCRRRDLFPFAISSYFTTAFLFAEKLYQRRFSPFVSRRSVDQVTAARIHHSHSIVDIRAVV